VKAKFCKFGLSVFEEHEVLELILFYAIPQRDTNELAHKLIEKFGSIKNVLEAPYELLVQEVVWGKVLHCF
ncbi:MAG: DNA repair protein RadC, partial [Oscillospiraceae bacterium]